MKNKELTTLPWGMPSVWTFVSHRNLLMLTLTDLGFRKFCMKLNFVPSIPALCMSIRMPCLHVKSKALSLSKKIDTTFSLFAASLPYCGFKRQYSSASVSPFFIGYLLLSSYCAPLTSRMLIFLRYLPVSCIPLFHLDLKVYCCWESLQFFSSLPSSSS